MAHRMQARVASIKDCKWLMSKVHMKGKFVDPFKLERIKKYTNVWGWHMEQEYGDENQG
jgi:hypothetical protein